MSNLKIEYREADIEYGPTTIFERIDSREWDIEDMFVIWREALLAMGYQSISIDREIVSIAERLQEQE